jgi:hypothetical protein
VAALFGKTRVLVIEKQSFFSVASPFVLPYGVLQFGSLWLSSGKRSPRTSPFPLPFFAFWLPLLFFAHSVRRFSLWEVNVCF